YFQVAPTQQGRLQAEAHANGFQTRLSLLRGDGGLLIQSDGQSLSDSDDLIVQNLQGVSGGLPYFLKVETLDGLTGQFELATTFQAAALPFVPIPVGSEALATVSGDFNGDHILDLATAGLTKTGSAISILLGVGDGTYRQAGSFATADVPFGM